MIGAMAATRPPHGEWAADRTYGSTVILTKAPPCGGVFLGDFVITPDTTREELAGVVSCGFHLIYSASGRDVHDLRCCACGEWIGDTRDPYVEHVSIPRQAECLSRRSPNTDKAPCRACEEMRAVTPSTTPPETP